MHRRIAAAENEEMRTAKPTAKAQLVLDRVIGTARVGASAGPALSKHRQCQFTVDMSRGRSLLGRQCPRHGFLATREIRVKIGAAVVAKASALRTFVRRASFSPPELQSIRRAWFEMGHSSWQGQLRAAPTADLVTALRVAEDEAHDSLMANPAGGAAGAPPDDEVARRHPRSVVPPPWG